MIISVQNHNTKSSVLYKPQARDSRAIQRGSTYSPPSGSEEHNEEHHLSYFWAEPDQPQEVVMSQTHTHTLTQLNKNT